MDLKFKCSVARLKYLSLLAFAIALVASLLLVSLQMSRYPAEQAELLRQRIAGTQLQPKDRIILEKDIVTYETDIRIKIWTATIQGAGGLALLLGLLFTWGNLRATQQKLDIDREGQLTNRFTQAAGQLGAEQKDGSPNIEVRLGGIYALDRIAHDSPKDYVTILEVLTAYVRHSAAWPPLKPQSTTKPLQPKPRTDVQAILTILGRPGPSERRLDLRETDLRGAEFWDAHLENTDFWGAHLEGAKLWGANLGQCKLENAHLEGANMRGTKLAGAILTNACLRETDLREADLSTATGLTQEQVDSAYSRAFGAALPPGLLSKGPASIVA